MKWLQQVLQPVKPWMSTTDVHVGDRWTALLGESLADHDLSVICVTPENKTSPWLLYEAGALSKAIGTAKVCPLLFQLAPSDLAGSPLSQFQAAPLNREGLRKLVSSLNNHLENEKISEDVLTRAFDAHWSDLEQALLKLEALDTEYEATQLPAILEVFARHNFPPTSISAAAFFREGFESHQLYEISTSVAKRRLYNYSRLNRKLIDKEHWEFFERIARETSNGFDLKLLFLDPNAPDHIIRSAHRDSDFREQLRVAIRNAVAIFQQFKLDPDKYCRTYDTDRPVAMTIVDDAVMFTRVKVDELGIAAPVTKSSFVIIHSRSELGTDLIEEFNLRWDNGALLKNSI